MDTPFDALNCPQCGKAAPISSDYLRSESFRRGFDEGVLQGASFALRHVLSLKRAAEEAARTLDSPRWLRRPIEDAERFLAGLKNSPT